MARLRGNRWQADALVNGKRVRRSFRTEEEALNFEAASAEGLEVPQSITLKPYVDEQFEALWGDTKAPRSHRINCNVLIDMLGEDTLLSAIDERRIDKFINDMRKRNSKNSTINRKLSTLSKILRRAARHRIIEHRPEIEFLPEDAGRDFVLTKDQERAAQRFFEQTGLELSLALFNFLLYTGCRFGEALKLKRDDVGGAGVLFADRKNRKRGATNTIVPLKGPALEGWEFACAFSESNKPFGDQMPYWTFRGHWRLLRDHLGLQDEECFVPHILRHTCCTRLVKSGVALPKVMKWMGHQNIQTTMGYSHLIPKDLDDAADALLKAD